MGPRAAWRWQRAFGTLCVVLALVLLVDVWRSLDASRLLRVLLTLGFGGWLVLRPVPDDDEPRADLAVWWVMVLPPLLFLIQAIGIASWRAWEIYDGVPR